MEEMNLDYTDEQVEAMNAARAEEAKPLTGKSLLDALFLRTAMNNMYQHRQKPGKNAKARALRAKARITKRREKRKA